MRALLVVNPSATNTTRRGRTVLTQALASELELEVAETRARGDAQAHGRAAAERGLDVVVVLGGDGTVNEVVNGLLACGPRPGLPDLALVPGGSTNVFARAVGLPRDPVEATGLVLDRLRSGVRRPIGLGRADSRYFTFCAGLGLDAQVVRTIDARRASGGNHPAVSYATTAVGEYLRRTDRRTPLLTLERPGADPVTGLFLAIVGNTAPWTYVGDRPALPTPRASVDTGLDLFAVSRLGLPGTLRHVRQIFSGSGRPPSGRSALHLHDEPELRFGAARPIALQVDGEYVGEVEQVVLRSVPAALQLLG